MNATPSTLHAPPTVSRPGSTFIPYPLAMAAMDQVLQHINTGIHSGGADICAFLGESGSGKTEVIRRLMTKKEFRPYRDASGTLMQPLVYVEITQAETPKSLAQRVLSALGDPKPGRGRSQAIIQERAIGMLKRKGCKLLIFDEAQQLVSKKYDAGDFFRLFVNQPVAPVLLVGLPEIAGMITANPQVGRRAAPFIRMKPLNWFVPQEQLMFMGILKALQKQLPPQYQNTPLAHLSIAMPLHIVSTGLIGRVTQVLRFACNLASKQNASALTQSIFAQATDEMFELYNETGTNAFRRGLQKLG